MSPSSTPSRSPSCSARSRPPYSSASTSAATCPHRPRTAPLPPISVLIPARNEERSIRAAVESVLASTGVDFELIVLDDASTDRTAQIVTELVTHSTAASASPTRPLSPPAGTASSTPAGRSPTSPATTPSASSTPTSASPPTPSPACPPFSTVGPAKLVSGFPRQITETWLEWLLLPLIHFVLLGFLPVSAMRKSTDPSFAAGCGQFLMVDRPAYFAAGGHSAIRETMHDGLRLPRLFRQHGLHTDLADLTDLAVCRMYTNAAEVWQGLAKNATEGIAAPARILPISILLFLGEVVPFLLAASLLLHRHASPPVIAYTLTAVAGAWLPRLLAVTRFRQPLKSALLHPVGILTLLAIQWYALARKTLGGPVTWKQRSYAGD